MKISSLSLFSEMTNTFNNYPPFVKKKTDDDVKV